MTFVLYIIASRMRDDEGIISRQSAMQRPAEALGAFVVSDSFAPPSNLSIHTTRILGLGSIISGIMYMLSLRVGLFRCLTQAQGNLTDCTTNSCMKKTKRRKLE